MLLLFETAAGYALFKVLKEGKLQEAEVRHLYRSLSTELQRKNTAAASITLDIAAVRREDHLQCVIS